jgi:hypothetical protein
MESVGIALLSKLTGRHLKRRGSRQDAFESPERGGRRVEAGGLKRGIEHKDSVMKVGVTSHCYMNKVLLLTVVMT